MTDTKRDAVEHKCKCCDAVISDTQYRFSTLCGLCDTGACMDSKRFHQLQRRLEEALREPAARVSQVPEASDRNQSAEVENVFLKEVLANCLIVLVPMAKGYAAEHPVGKNAGMVVESENNIKLALGIELDDAGFRACERLNRKEG